MNIVEYTEYLVKSLVEDPEMIKVEEFMEDETKIIEVMVPEDQMKYVIGKGGKNARELIFNRCGHRTGQRLGVGAFVLS